MKPTRSSRQVELERFAGELRWLDGEAARRSAQYADRFMKPGEYRLKPVNVAGLERHRIDGLGVASAWLRQRIRADGSVRIVYGETDVCVTSTAFFLEKWTELFGPARDDVIILSNEEDWIAFCWHEDELELGKRRSGAA